MIGRLVVKITLQKIQGDGKYYIVQQEDFYQPEVRSIPYPLPQCSLEIESAGYSVPYYTISWTAFNGGQETGDGWLHDWRSIVQLPQGMALADERGSEGRRVTTTNIETMTASECILVFPDY